MIEIVLIAIAREVQAYKYYTGALKRAKDENAKEMFLHFAEQKKIHESKLKPNFPS